MNEHGLLVIRLVWTAIFSGFGIFLIMRRKLVLERSSSILPIALAAAQFL